MSICKRSAAERKALIKNMSGITKHINLDRLKKTLRDKKVLRNEIKAAMKNNVIIDRRHYTQIYPMLHEERNW